jgi:hypothetical protein
MELHKAYGRLMEIQAREGREGCVQPEAILALVERSDDEEVRLQTLDHVMACPPCLREFELLRAVATPRSESKTPSRPSFGLKPRRFAWAASLILLIGAGSIWMNVRQAGPGGVMRGDETELRLISPVAGAPLQDGMTFVWHPLPEGFEYTVEVLDGKGEVIFAGSTRDTTFTIPGRLQAGDDEGLRWWVTARTGNGARTSSEIRILGPASD